MILIVTYELKQSADSYSDLFEALKAHDSWSHYIPSTWLIATDSSPKELYQKLVGHVFQGDRILIAQLVPGYYGLLPTKAWDWIKRYRDK
jgi:hypothetical protein